MTIWFGEMSVDEIESAVEVCVTKSKDCVLAPDEWERLIESGSLIEDLPERHLDDKMQIINRLADQTTTANLRSLLIGCWRMTELAHRFGVDRVVSWFRRAGAIDELCNVSWPNEPLTIWRGSSSSDEQTGRGLSWTTDEGAAEKFAWRRLYPKDGHEAGWLWKARLPPHGILARFQDAWSDEYIVDPWNLEDVQCVGSVPVPDHIQTQANL